MEHWKKKNSFSYKDLLYKALIFVGTVAFIVYFLPRDGKFNYQFDINKPWKYGQLMATFDFPIYKDEAVVKREQDSLLASFQPYFELDKEVEKSALAKLKENYHAHLKGILPSTDYIRYIERGLKAIYQSGVVSTEEMRTLLHDSIFSVMVIEDKLANQRTTDGIYTVKRAYENLISGDTAHYNRDILRQCALNDYITPNLIYDSVRTETARKEGFRTDILRGEDGSLALALKKYGKLRFVTARKARVLTGYGTISADGSLFSSFKKRAIKGLRSFTALFYSKNNYEDEDSNLIK